MAHTIEKTINDELAELRALINSDPQSAIKHGLALAAKAKSSEDIELKAEVFHVVGLSFHQVKRFEEGLAWYNEALLLWRLGRNKIGEAKTLNNIGLIYYGSSQFKEAIPFFMQAANLKLELKEYKSLTGTYVNLGVAYERLSEHKKAIEVLYKGLKISEKSGDDERTAMIYDAIGNVYKTRGDDRQALEIYQKARKLRTSDSDKIQLIHSKINIGNQLQALRKYKESLQYYEQSLQMAYSINRNSDILLITHNISVVLKRLGKLDEALLTSKKALELAISANDFLVQCNALTNIGEIHTLSKNYTDAESYLKQALLLAKNMGLKHNEVEIYLLFSRLFEAMKQPAKALQYYKLYDKVKSNLNKAEIANRINQLNTQYEVSKKEEELLVSRALQTESELKALRAQMDPHFIFNALSSMRKELLEGDIDKADHYIVRFSRLLRLILDTTRTPQVKLSDNVELLHLYIQIEQSRQANSFDYKINIAKGIRPESVYIPGMILQPLIENAIVHGLFHKQHGRGKLNIAISKTGKVLKIKVSDNGVGRQSSTTEKAKGHRSHATSIIRETLALAWKNKMKDRYFVINDKINTQGEAIGTEVIVLLPLASY